VVDGTGLENRHTLTGIGGSNPSLSAIESALQRILSDLCRNVDKLRQFREYFAETAPEKSTAGATHIES
jgi:hypothetical protein